MLCVFGIRSMLDVFTHCKHYLLGYNLDRLSLSLSLSLTHSISCDVKDRICELFERVMRESSAIDAIDEKNAFFGEKKTKCFRWNEAIEKKENESNQKANECGNSITAQYNKTMQNE
ncbi:integral membrane protein [Sarcoptes scabiei]|nr:integral membrane protein [Sarcoptes scabiei]